MILLILAAGLGSRYGGAKQVDALGPQGEWIMDLNLRDAAAAGFKRAVVVCRAAMVDTITAHLAASAPAGLQIDLAIQDPDDLPRAMPPRQRPWGTGHALLAARALLDAPFLVANADDCYGPGCFQAAAAFLAQRCAAGRAALVAYRLDRCCSAHGGVSRGICRATGARLHAVVEHHGVCLVDGAYRGQGPQGPVTLAGHAPVSLNSWCLPADCCALLWQSFATWLAGCPAEDAEFQLPTALDGLLQAGLLQIELLPCSETWLGLTYQADRDAVVAHLERRYSACEVRCSR